MDSKTLQNIRQDYSKEELDLSHVDKDPIKQFSVWFQEALSAKVLEPNAMTLSTASLDGKPSSRVVLLKGIDDGFVFFTNYGSRKGHHLDQNPNASLNFFWPELERQVRIEGSVVKVTAEESNEYFDSRPFGSKIGAHVSPQSEKIDSRNILEAKVLELEKSYTNENIKRPDNWGGYRLVPDYMEFWQGRPSRLHDRICFMFKNNEWHVFRVAP